MLSGNIKRFLLREALKSGVKLRPFLSEEKIFQYINSQIESMENPQARRFVEKALYVTRNHMERTSENCRKRGLSSFFLNAVTLGMMKREEFEKEHGFSPPFVILISPTMRCNLRCEGCYAAHYSVKDDLEFGVIDRVISEAKDIGCYFFTILGGEPFIRKELFNLYERHSDAYFQVFTNGTLIDERVADRIAQVGNIFPSISVDGMEEYSDKRRGKGTFKKLMHAMDLLNERGAFFGFSTVVTRENNEVVVSDEYIDMFVERNCFWGWYFAYMPVGKAPDVTLMPTPEQRLYRFERIKEMREKRDIILADFWNDAPLVGGCIAGGRKYLHINNNGDVEPCIFVHFSVDNIREKSLKEVLFSPFFHEIRKRIPIDSNHLMPCMIIDSPHILRDIIAETGAVPDYPEAKNILKKEIAFSLDEYSSELRILCNPVWQHYLMGMTSEKVCARKVSDDRSIP